jgi:hypothetical protein
MWYYVQRTGSLYRPTGELLTVGYAGWGICKNNPAMQALSDRGPLPCGDYVMLEARNEPTGPGPDVIPLAPDPRNTMLGRSGFAMHGDKIAKPGWASHGCIVVAPAPRRITAASQDRQLRVVAEESQVGQ